MSTRMIWILAGSAFGVLLGFVTGSTPIGLAIVAVVGGVAGGMAEHLQARRKSQGKQ